MPVVPGGVPVVLVVLGCVPVVCLVCQAVCQAVCQWCANAVPVVLAVVPVVLRDVHGVPSGVPVALDVLGGVPVVCLVCQALCQLCLAVCQLCKSCA